MQAAELFDVLYKLLADPNDRLGGNLLGEYIRSNAPGDPEPAITIDKASPDINRITGLECIIPLMPSEQMIGQDAIEVVQRFDVILVQRSPPPRDDPEAFATIDEPKLPQAVERLKVAFAYSYRGDINGVYVPADDVLGAYAQYRFPVTAVEYQRFFGFVNAIQQGLN